MNFIAKPIEEQKSILERLLLKGQPIVQPKVDDGMEGEFVILKWQSIADTYPEALKKIFAVIKETRDFYNLCEDEIDSSQIRMTEKTSSALTEIGKKQKGDFIIIIGAQTGIKYKGKSVKQAREDFGDKEFGLDSFSIACILLTHPERLKKYDDLWIDCPGDELAPEAGDAFTGASCWDFHDGRLEFRSYWLYYPHEHYGSASGVRPE